MKNILTYERYGKQNIIRKVFLDVKNRFTINKFVEEDLKRRGIGCYVPKINKLRFTIGMGLAIIFVILPVVTPLSIVAILWGIK